MKASLEAVTIDKSATPTASSHSRHTGTEQQIRRWMWAAAVTALLFRLGWMFVAQTYWFASAPNHFLFGWETGSIAANLATGHGFSSPFGVPSGPTAWVSPIYPLLLAGLFKIFGLYSVGAAIGILGFNCVVSAAVVPVTYLIAKRIFSPTVALVAAWYWAIVPLFARWAVLWVWENAFASLLCAVVVLLTLRAERGRWRDWLWLGVAWGIAGLTSPSLLGFMPASLLYPAWRMRKQVALRSSLVKVIACGAVMFALFSPWLVRNYRVFHKPVFLRSNFWFETTMSNFHLGTGELWVGKHPTHNSLLLNRYLELGEQGFVAESKQKTIRFIKEYPDEFIGFVVLRIADFWDGHEEIYTPRTHSIPPWQILVTSLFGFAGLGIAIAQGKQWGLFAWVLFLFPIPYYFTFTSLRYRHSIDSVIVVLSAYFFTETWKATRIRIATGRWPSLTKS